MPDNKLQFILPGLTGIAARMSVLLRNQADAASVISLVTEDSTYGGFYSAIMVGAAGEYTASVLLDSLPIHSGEGAFVWNGTNFVYPLNALAVRSALGMAAANLDTQLADIPTVAEFNARSLLAADYFVVGDYTAPTNLTAAQVWAFATRGLTDKVGFELSPAGVVAIEAALLNEGDGQPLIDAIVLLINTNLNLPPLETALIAAAVRTNLATELGRLDATISSRATPQTTWEYASGDRTLTGPQSTALAAISSIPINPLRTNDARLNNLDAAISGINPLDATATQAAAAAAIAAATLSSLTGADIATALTTYGAAQTVNVTAAQTAILAGGFVASDRTLLTAAKTTAEGVAIGDHLIDYAASTATQKDAAGNVIAVFDLLDENDNPATSASTAVKRVRR